MDLDTSEAQRRKYAALLRAQAPSARLEAAAGLTRTVRQLAWAGLKDRHPGESDDDLRVRLTLLLYGPEGARRVFGEHRLIPR